jgi:Tfp pilus assembly protein PilX
MRFTRTQSTQGNVLLVVIIFSAMLAVLVLSGLALVSNKNTLTVRSLDWNNAMPLAEAGIEEALSHLQFSQNTNFQTDAWTLSNGKFYKTRTNLVNYGYYSVVIQATNYAVGLGPTIISTGYVAVPFGNIDYSAASFAGSGSGTNSFIHRTVSITTSLRGGNPRAVLVRNTINMSGSSYVDSFNSQDTNYSINGLWTASKRKATAMVASLSTSTSDFQVGNGFIYGSVATGAASGNPSIGGGRVGDLAFVGNSANNGRFQAGSVVNSFSAPLADVTAPFTTGSIISSGTYGGTNYTYYAGSGNYSTVGDFTIAGGQSMVIAGTATIYIGGKFTESGSGFLYIAPGASLTMYVAGSSCTVSGGGILNGGGNAANCSINCLPTCTTGTISGSGNYIGTFNAPEAAVTLSGSADMSGALIADSAVFSGGMNLHYDENLGTGGRPNYAVTSWRELP